MASRDSADLSSRSGSLVEAHTNFEPRILAFYLMATLLLLVLMGGLAYQQLIKTDVYNEAERLQNQRRVLVPGPRGNIYDREGRLLVGNKPRFSVVLYLDELKREFRREYIQIRKNYRQSGDKDIPSPGQMERIARGAVVQRYLDQVCRIIGRSVELSNGKLRRHFDTQLLLPFPLVTDLTPEEYAKLLERLDVRSPLQLYVSSTRYYPHEQLASHTIGFVGYDVEIEAEDFGEDLTPFKMKGATGKDGLELQFDTVLQGEPGGTIYRVDPAGYRINPPVEKRLPVQGRNIVSSIDLDLQQVAEETIADARGAAVLMDVRNGEVLVLASKPTRQDGNWLNLAVNGLYMPGSTFKIITTLAGMRAGTITPNSVYRTNGTYTVGNRVFRDHAGCITGDITLALAIEESVNTFYYHFGLETGIERIANEAKRFGLDDKTGIELPNETSRMLVGTPEWKRERSRERAPWSLGDTANVAIGQGYIQVSPLQMACFMASLARGETRTKPTLIHQSPRPDQHSAPIDISPEYYRFLIDNMVKVVESGTGKLGRIEGLNIAGKTGTAQVRTKQGTIELAWFVGFAPAENPEVSFAVLMEGDTPDENFGGGRYSAPIIKEVLKKWLEKKKAPPAIKNPVLP